MLTNLRILNLEKKKEHQIVFKMFGLFSAWPIWRYTYCTMVPQYKSVGTPWVAVWCLYDASGENAYIQHALYHTVLFTKLYRIHKKKPVCFSVKLEPHFGTIWIIFGIRLTQILDTAVGVKPKRGFIQIMQDHCINETLYNFFLYKIVFEFLTISKIFVCCQ